MPKEEQIEEMTSICYVSICHQIGGGDFVQAGDRRAAGEICAEELYESGYRKADEVRRETAREILDKILKVIEFEASLDDKNATFNLCSEVVKDVIGEYGVGVEDESTD